MKKCLFIYVAIMMLFFSVHSSQAVAASSNLQNDDRDKFIVVQNEELDKEQIDEVIVRVKELASEYNGIEKRQLLNDERLISSEKKGNSDIICILDKDKGEKREFIFTNNSIKSINYRNNEGDGFDIFYYADGVIGSFVGYKNNKLHGAFVKFHKNGNLHYVANCKDGKFVGRTKVWDEAGNLTESVEFKEPQNFQINKIAPAEN